MKLKNRYDIIVAGAGIAGISAAIKAGRSGASVLLIEHYGFVGGMSTAGMVSPFMKHSVNGKFLVRGIFEEIENEMINRKGMIDNGFFANSFRASSFSLLKKANVKILFHTDIYYVKSADKRIVSIGTLCNGIDIEIEGNIFIDTTGDAQLVYLGNFPWAKGDESTGKLQALTLFFRMGGIDINEAISYVKNHKEDFFNWVDFDFDFNRIISIAGYFNIVKKAVDEKRLPPEIQYIFYTTLPATGEASFNTTNILGLDGSTSFDLTQAEITGRDQVSKTVKILQEEIPGFQNSYLIETAVQVGVRETRRGIGDYILTGEDIITRRKFDNPVARGCYGIDIHGQKDEKNRMDEIPDGEYYEVPLQSLIIKDSANLLVAGRCISATREGHAALRIMPTSAATGEACGALAALAVKFNKPVREVEYKLLQNEIKQNILFEE